MTTVVFNRNGSCEGYTFIKDIPVELPDTVLKAIGSDKYEVLDEEQEEDKPSYKELQIKAKALGLPTNKKYSELEILIANAEAGKEDEE